MKKLGNVLTGLFHIAGLCVLAYFCFLKHLNPGCFSKLDWTNPLCDFVLIIAAVALIAMHYLFIERVFYHPIRTWLLALFEAIIAVVCIICIIIPNDMLYVSLNDGLIIMIVQLLIVSARVFSIVNHYRTVPDNQSA